MMTFWSDIKYCIRQLLKNPGFTIIAVLTLALGIGACTGVFSLVDAILLRPLPFHEPERLVWIQNNLPGGSLSLRTLTVDGFIDWRDQAQSFEDVGAYHAFFKRVRYSLTGEGEPQSLRGIQITQNFLDVLGVQPLLGRNFLEEECAGSGLKAAILSHAFWRQKFGGDPDVVGRSVTINGQSVSIVGVMSSYTGLDAIFSADTEVELLLPFPLTPEYARQGHTLFGIGRLKPGVTFTQAQKELAVIRSRWRISNPQCYEYQVLHSILLDDYIRGSFRPAFILLGGAVLCVLLIACINLSNLLLARAHARRQEYAVRIALGASHWRLACQTLTENLLLAFIGCLLGIFAVSVAIAPLSRIDAFGIPLLHTISINGTTLWMAVVLSCVAALLCSMLPAIQLRHRQASDVMHDAGERGSTGSTAWIRRILVVSEIALACVLLAGSGLLVRSFMDLLQTDLGFQPANTFAWRVSASRSFNFPEERLNYFDRLVERISAVPGVKSAGLSDQLPLAYIRSWGARAEGITYEPNSLLEANIRVVDQRFLETMQTPLLAGRYFDDLDVREGRSVIIINETLARNLWLGENPIERTAFVGGRRYTVVGVVADVPHGIEGKPQPDVYFNFRQQDDWSDLRLVVRTDRGNQSLIPAIRAAIREFDPLMPYNEFTTLDHIVEQAISPRRLITGILSSFSSCALLLAAIGLYGVIAYSVGRRTQEIGIRVAVGAQHRDIIRMVLLEGLALAGVGVVFGLIAACFVTRVLQSQLYGVTAGDPFTYTITVIILVGVTLLACYLPARHATRIDPMEALRYE